MSITSQGQRLVNTAKLVLNVEQQRAPDNANYYSSILSCGYIHPSCSAHRINPARFPLWVRDWWWPEFILSCIRLLVCKHQPCSFSLLWSTFSSAKAEEKVGSEAQSFLRCCQVARTTVKSRYVSYLQFPGCSVWPLAPDRQCDGGFFDILKWPFLSEKTLF